jgi:hypothetical protein
VNLEIEWQIIISERDKILPIIPKMSIVFRTFLVRETLKKIKKVKGRKFTENESLYENVGKLGIN